VSQNKTRLLRSMYWAYDQHALLHSWRCTRGWGQWLVKTIARLKSQPVCVLAKTDEVGSPARLVLPFVNLGNLDRVQIDHLFQMIIYVCQNEDTSCLKIVHFYRHEEFIPSEIEANAKSECPVSIGWCPSFRLSFVHQFSMRHSQRSRSTL
jgi:hypothetical protein